MILKTTMPRKRSTTSDVSPSKPRAMNLSGRWRPVLHDTDASPSPAERSPESRVAAGRSMPSARRVRAALISCLALLTTALCAAEWPVPLHVIDWGNVRRVGFPAAGGVPFPQGMLAPEDVAALKVRDASGLAPPSQLRAENTWPDGSVKWLSATFLCDQDPGGTNRYTLAPATDPTDEKSLLARMDADGVVVVDTGPLRATFGPYGARVYVGDVLAAGPLRSRIWTRDPHQDGERTFTLTLSDAVIESNGPITTVVKVEGWHESDGGARFSPSTVRLTFTRGQSFVRVAHTFVMSEDPDDTLISGIALLASLPNASDRLAYLDGLTSKTVPLAGGPASIQQQNVAEPTYPPSSNEFTGLYTVSVGGDDVAAGERYPGVASLLGERLNVGVYVDRFWQMSPTAIDYDPDSGDLTIGLWPHDGAHILDLSRTEQRRPPHYEAFAANDPLYEDPKYGRDYVPHDLEHSAMGVAGTHDVVLWFAADADNVDPLKLYIQLRLPYTPFVSGEWNAASGVMGKQNAPGAHRNELEDANLRVMDELWNRSEQHGWYGWMEHGNLRYAYDKQADSWMPYHPKYAWYNSGHMMEGGTLLEALWFQYLRTGSPLLYLLAQARGRSVMDVSTVHHHDDASLVGAMIRHGGYDPWAGSRATHGAHAPLAGLPIHHFVTGNPRAADVTRLVGDRNYLERDLNHGRNIDTDINTMTQYWEFTGDDRHPSRALEYLDYYHDTLDRASEELTYVDYRTHALRALYEAVDDAGVRAKIGAVFDATDKAYAAAGRQGNIEMAAFAYELHPDAETALRLERAVERRARRVSGALGWLDTMPLRGMDDVATVNAVNYALYWLRHARDGRAEPVRMTPDGGTFTTPVVVELFSPTRRGTVVYALDDDVSPLVWLPYEGPFEVAGSASVVAQVFGIGLTSPVPTQRAFNFQGSPVQNPAPRLWLRSDVGVTTDGRKVTGWADQSGYGKHATAKAPTAPTLADGSLLGAGSSHMRLSRLVPLEGDCTVVFVASFDTTPGDTTPGKASLGVVIGDGDDGWIGVTPDGALHARFSSADGGWSAAGGGDVSRRSVWTLVRRGDTLSALRDGQLIGRTDYASRTTMNAGLIMGMREDANRMDGSLSEVIVFDTALADERLDVLWGYLRDRHKIDSGGVRSK